MHNNHHKLDQYIFRIYLYGNKWLFSRNACSPADSSSTQAIVEKMGLKTTQLEFYSTSFNVEKNE